MANIKSAKKRILVSETRAERNKAIRSKVKTFVKKVQAAVESGDKALAEEAHSDTALSPPVSLPLPSGRA